MSSCKQWPVKRPLWAALLAALILLGVVSSLAYLSFYIVPVVLLLLWRFRHACGFGSGARAGQLSLGAQGNWELVSAYGRQQLSLRHIWPGFAWTTLRFSDPNASNPKDAMLELTIWKSSVSPEAWRQLCVYVAGHGAQGGPHANVRGAS